MNDFSEAKLQDLFIPLDEFHWVPANASLGEAVMLFTKFKNTGQIILVRDNNLPVGFINIECFLGSIEPNSLEGVSIRGRNVKTSTGSIPVFWKGKFSDCCMKLKDLTAKDVMVPFKTTIGVNEPLIKAVYNLNKYKNDVIPVTENNQIIGLIGYNSIFKEIVSLTKNNYAEVIDINKAITPKKQPAEKSETS
ncbi:MAG: hypothetical protein VR69_08410 [Peptococcaceae bacterium BRH_c4b]|nr:MAG: hypothetical protein VR69_08410 [Peptococcaceae bacterium BRH_c4b]